MTYSAACKLNGKMRCFISNFAIVYLPSIMLTFPWFSRLTFPDQFTYLNLHLLFISTKTTYKTTWLNCPLPIVIHSFIRLQSRRLQIFSKHIDLQLMRQLHLVSDHFLHPQKASVNRIGSLSSAVLVSFCRELEHTGHIFCMAPLQAS